jgi:hypothetical protein
VNVENIMRRQTDVALVIAQLQEEIDSLIAACLRQKHLLDQLLTAVDTLPVDLLARSS